MLNYYEVLETIESTPRQNLFKKLTYISDCDTMATATKIQKLCPTSNGESNRKHGKIYGVSHPRRC